MPGRAAIIISPNWRDHAHKYLNDCMKGIRAQDWDGQTSVFIVDNETTSESFAFISRMAPEAEVIRNKENRGFAGGNNDAMRVAIERGFDYIALFNMDTVIDAGCLREMVSAVENDERTAAVQARLMLWPDEQKINSMGNVTHFLGFGYSSGYGEDISGFRTVSAEAICYPSGAAVLYRAEALRKVGLFDEEFWMNNEDQDLGWRIWLSGFRCVMAPDAIAHHKYEFSRYADKFYWVDRNRILAALKNYRWPTLMLLIPAFLLMEAGLLLFSLRKGWFVKKIMVYKYLLTPGKWFYIWNARQRTQRLRRVKDRDIIGMFSGRVLHSEIKGPGLVLANTFFSIYWGAARKFIFW
jgi:GT2 family glycosyltransferase